MFRPFLSKVIIGALGFSALFTASVIYADDYYPKQNPSNPSNPSNPGNPGGKKQSGRGREEIALRDNDDDKQGYTQTTHRGNWDYRENWRFDRNAYLSGMNQSQFDEHLYPHYGYGSYTYPSVNAQYGYNYPTTQQNNQAGYQAIYPTNANAYSQQYNNQAPYQATYPTNGYSQQYNNPVSYPTGGNLTTNYYPQANGYGNYSSGYYNPAPTSAVYSSYPQTYGYGSYYSNPTGAYQTNNAYSRPGVYSNYSNYYNQSNVRAYPTNSSDDFHTQRGR